MRIFILLLRGINVGGHKKVPMAALREILGDLGFACVNTYIQSGNIILKSKENSETIKSQIEQTILNHFGFEVLVQVKTLKELKYVYKNCPFSKEEKEKSYFIMLNTTPNKYGLEDVNKLQYKDEKIKITTECIYFYSKNGYGHTKFNSNFFERKLKVNATARNYKTILKLLAMAEELETKL